MTALDLLAVVREALERAGCDPRGCDDDFTARCPAHDDRTPSLSVRAGTDGRVLLLCRAGCPTERVLEAIGLDWRRCSRPIRWTARTGRGRRSTGSSSSPAA